VIAEQIAQVDRELELLQQPVCRHPNFLAQMECVDERRDKETSHQGIKLTYELKSLRIKTSAERQQHQSQYFQTVRDIREQSLDAAQRHHHALQRDRRRWGADDRNFAPMYNPTRAVQLKRQEAITLEVSVLSGVAKYVGFPAAPELPSLQSTDIEEDLRAMRVRDCPSSLVRTRA